MQKCTLPALHNTSNQPGTPSLLLQLAAGLAKALVVVEAYCHAKWKPNTMAGGDEWGVWAWLGCASLAGSRVHPHKCQAAAKCRGGGAVPTATVAV